MKCDLHIHSNYSDGYYTVDIILNKAKMNGVQIISITDHDTVQAYQLMKKEEGIRVITGLELSCCYRGREIHALAYHFDSENRQLLDFLEEYRKYQYFQTLFFMRRIKSLKLPDIVETQILKHKIRRIHIIEAFQKHKLPQHYYWELDEILEEVREQKKLPPFQEGQKVIREAGGVIVMAHPYRYFKDEKTLNEVILELKPDGIECFSPIHDPQYTQLCISMVKRHQLLVGGGSDYHSGNYQLDFGYPEEHLTVINHRGE